MAEPWNLKRTKQCAKCPWKKSVDPTTIPNGYDVAKHEGLEKTIATDPLSSIGQQHVMACHETHDSHCIGWLVNQLGPGNNIGMRLRMLSCQNAKEIKLDGPQHQTFEDTLPKKRRKRKTQS